MRGGQREGSDLLFKRAEGWGAMQISKHASSLVPKGEEQRSPSPHCLTSIHLDRRSTRR